MRYLPSASQCCSSPTWCMVGWVVMTLLFGTHICFPLRMNFGDPLIPSSAHFFQFVQSVGLYQTQFYIPISLLALLWWGCEHADHYQVQPLRATSTAIDWCLLYSVLFFSFSPSQLIRLLLYQFLSGPHLNLKCLVAWRLWLIRLQYVSQINQLWVRYIYQQFDSFSLTYVEGTINPDLSGHRQAVI